MECTAIFSKIPPKIRQILTPTSKLLWRLCKIYYDIFLFWKFPLKWALIIKIKRMDTVYPSYRRAVTCAWLNLKFVPKNIPPDTTMLNLKGNQITKWRPRMNLKLLGLDLSFNEFSAFPVGLPDSLNALWLGYNHISQIRPKEFGIVISNLT